MGIKTEDLGAFLEKYPAMSLAPSRKDKLIVQGILSLNIMDEQYGVIKDYFSIKIVIPKRFPEDIPTVYELGERFPKTSDFHVNLDSLCLGTPLGLKKRIKEEPTLEGFINNCIAPYFYSIALYLQGKERFILGELKHGLEGIIQDYMETFNLKSIEQVLNLLEILSLKSNRGNKEKCPCGCKRVVTKCSLHKKIVQYRDVMNRKEFEEDRRIISLALNAWKKTYLEQKERRDIPLA